MNETNITMRYDRETDTWTIIVDGKTHHHLSSSDAEALVEYTMVATEQTSGKPVVRSANERTELDRSVSSGRRHYAIN